MRQGGMHFSLTFELEWMRICVCVRKKEKKKQLWVKVDDMVINLGKAQYEQLIKDAKRILDDKGYSQSQNNEWGSEADREVKIQ